MKIWEMFPVRRAIDFAGLLVLKDSHRFILIFPDASASADPGGDAEAACMQRCQKNLLEQMVS